MLFWRQSMQQASISICGLFRSFWTPESQHERPARHLPRADLASAAYKSYAFNFTFQKNGSMKKSNPLSLWLMP